MANFQNVLVECNLFDLGYKFTDQTYDNKQSGIDNVKARLDRGVASPERSNYFKEASVEHLCSTRSDHLPLLLWFGTHKEWRPLKKSFRYEAMWDRVETLSETMSHAWNNNVQDDSLAGVLSTWALKDFCSIQNKINTIRSRLKKLWRMSNSADIERKIKQA